MEDIRLPPPPKKKKDPPQNCLGLKPDAYVLGSELLISGMVIPLSIRNPYNGYINPYYLVDIPYYMEITGVLQDNRK